MTHVARRPPSRRSLVLPACLVLAGFTPSLAVPQTRGTGTLSGSVVRREDATPLSGVAVSVKGTALRAVTLTNGRFTLQRVPDGPQTLLFQALGYRPEEVAVRVTAGQTLTANVVLDMIPVLLGDIVVEAPSRGPERVVEAPAAVAVVDPALARVMSVTGQAPVALGTVPGVDVVQSGLFDFNVNARGFNSSLNRRVLVLLDGRDLAVPFVGAQEWNSLTLPLDEMGRIEVVRGPGSALYGANAFSGVVSISSPAAREVVGTRLTLAGGDLASLRGDVRHARVVSNGRFGFRLNAGYNRSDTWSRSRTRLDGSDFAAEYAPATDQPVNAPTPGFEFRPLNGQSRDPTTGAAIGETDHLVNLYASARFDHYTDGGAVGTLEGGASQADNEVVVVGIGRVQVTRTIRPWARLAWASRRYNLMAWYSGRNTLEPQYSLGSGLALEERSAIVHLEGQYNRGILGERGRVVLGGSARQYRVDTQGTLMAPADDDRSDLYYSAYGQVEYRVLPQLRAVAAARFDDGDLFQGQFSPKAGVVYSPNERHSLRLTVNRAFQTPNYAEFFVRVPAGPSTGSPRTLEQGLESYFATIRASFAADPSLPPTPADLPWNFDSLTQALVLGNGGLNVEKVTAWEVGYKGSVSSRAYVSVDLYTNRLTDFVTDILPAAVVMNPAYPSYPLTEGGTNVPQALADVDAYLAGQGLPPSHPLRAANAQLQSGYGQLDAGLVQSGLLATLPDGRRAVVLSLANAGRVTERGLEVGAGYHLSDGLRVEGSYTLFDFEPPTGTLAGDQVLPNTPRHKGTLTLSYEGRHGFDLLVSMQLRSAFDWAAGVYSGRVESMQTVNVGAGYAVSSQLRLHALATNLFDQRRFQFYGGSVNGRRVIAGVTATF